MNSRVFLAYLACITTAVYAENARGGRISYPPGGRLDPVIERIEELCGLSVFPDTAGKHKPHPDKSSHPTFPDLVYEYKIADIGKLSPISFDYNPHVRRYIDIYTQERREQVAQMLGLAELYFPLFDEMLDRYRLPLELKYLAVVESALNPLAVSKTGAAGLWQFKINTARMFDLTVNSYIDERMDPVKSTDAACQYLQYLYRIFNDWRLALAAYNTGPGEVKRAIQRSGGETNFWKLFVHLPEAAQNYVPAFIAASYVMRNAREHGITAVEPTVLFMDTDTVMVTKPISLAILSREVDLPLDMVRFLNPVFRCDYVPDLGKPIPLRLPTSKMELFIQKEQLIYDSPVPKASYSELVMNSGSTNNKIQVQYRVKSGDYLHKIALVHGCTLDDLALWNPGIENEISVGQLLTIWVDAKMYRRLLEGSKADSLRVVKQ